MSNGIMAGNEFTKLPCSINFKPCAITQETPQQYKKEI